MRTHTQREREKNLGICNGKRLTVVIDPHLPRQKLWADPPRASFHYWQSLLIDLMPIKRASRIANALLLQPITHARTKTSTNLLPVIFDLVLLYVNFSLSLSLSLEEPIKLTVSASLKKEKFNWFKLISLKGKRKFVLHARNHWQRGIVIHNQEKRKKKKGGESSQSLEN